MVYLSINTIGKADLHVKYKYMISSVIIMMR